MSEYCGKCDLWDSLVMIRDYNDESAWDKITIYQLTDDSEFTPTGWTNMSHLKVKSLKDLIPYAPYVPAMSFGNGDSVVYVIGQKSFITIEEEERFGWAIKYAQRICKSFKRKHEELTLEELTSKVGYFYSCRDDIPDWVVKICERVLEHPYSKCIKIDDLSNPFHNYYRQNLYNDMIKYGYTEHEAHEWVYNGNKAWE